MYLQVSSIYAFIHLHIVFRLRYAQSPDGRPRLTWGSVDCVKMDATVSSCPDRQCTWTCAVQRGMLRSLRFDMRISLLQSIDPEE